MRLSLTAVSVALSASLACASRAADGGATAEPVTQTAATDRGGTFSVSSYASTYYLRGRFEGSYVIEPESVVVTVRGGAVRSSIPARLEEMAVMRDVWVAAGFGMPHQEGWTIDTLAPEVTVASTLAGEAEVPIGALRFVIPRRAGVSLAERWLIFQVGGKHAGLFDRPAGSRMANYVCAEANLLGPTAASRERERRMERDYSKIC